MSDTGELCFLPAIMQAIERRAPNIALRTVTLPPAALKEAFASGSVDLAVGHFPDLDTAMTATEELTSDCFVCIARRDHPVARSPLSLETFLACEHAVVAARSRFQRLFEGAIERLGFELKVRLRPEHFVSLMFIIGTTDLIATVPSAIAEAFRANGDILAMPLPVAVPQIVVAQHWHRRHESDPEVRWLRDLVRELFAGQELSKLSAGTPM